MCMLININMNIVFRERERGILKERDGERGTEIKREIDMERESVCVLVCWRGVEKK